MTEYIVDVAYDATKNSSKNFSKNSFLNSTKEISKIVDHNGSKHLVTTRKREMGYITPPRSRPTKETLHQISVDRQRMRRQSKLAYNLE
jgi:hypothetical protein